ncbi:aminopeptidase P N-terminal domain-containing protein [Caldimonas thermodepolymerans]|uniref:Xaa-Pro aminopeptidase n=1 Tax=Caldimonas thermodepolymerans TaxID=215580 RepID=A0A2S5T3Q7_9BURK|nr:aminopeptidase P N-terminal domain-containing protein [Caldimonas thermodepolymerans]PPE69621.1 Xaa-Pro aminopeptidase [Caldimonas thermodepolymerans]QPC31970.1 aminopeptidase P N-terminal domain-containing protein [Caldimonas thermodepolymerans]RDI01509.1 aminopeptidase P [Caldimonas thermodepolymerans]
MDRTIYLTRRLRVAEAMREQGGGIALVPTAPERVRNRDTHHPYRHDSYFFYLSGFGEPESWLVIDEGGRSTLFCRPKDLERETWDGLRLGPEAAPGALGVDEAFPVELLDEYLPQLMANRRAVWFPFGVHEGLEQRVEGWLAAVRARERQGQEAPRAMRDLCAVLDEMRVVKDEHELATMRRAAEISAAAHVRAMRASARWLRGMDAGPWYEYHLEAELLHEFRRHGAQAPAYPSIVAAGANACILHYPAGNAELRPGQLCLIDAGCELDGYASDITRTFPLDGRYTGPQRELYDLVLAAQDAAVAATRPGARQRDAHHAAVRVLAQGMLDTGLLDRDRHGSVDDVIETAAYRRFYMHGTGHWLGMDVHDVGSYQQDDEPPVEQPDGLGGRVVKKPSRILQPGMVVTIEPGIYVRAAEDVPERYWNIGIRIEDDAVVTPGGCELITRGVPVRAEEIEALMREA